MLSERESTFILNFYDVSLARNFYFSLLSNFTRFFFSLLSFTFESILQTTFFFTKLSENVDKLLIQVGAQSRWWRCFDYFSISQKSLWISVSFNNFSIAVNVDGTGLRLWIIQALPRGIKWSNNYSIKSFEMYSTAQKFRLKYSTSRTV